MGNEICIKYYNNFNKNLKQKIMKKKTIYHLIVDKSGSMSDCIENTINGFNEQVKRITQIDREFPEQDITIGLTTFNTEVRHHFFQVNPIEVQKLSQETYHPDGGTALLDAIGITARSIENATDIGNPENGTTAVIVILTDGYENSSKLFKLGDIRNLIGRLEATGNWTFSFIGATLDAVDVAEQMSIKRQNSYSFDKSEMKNEVWDKLSNSMRGYINKKKSGKDLGNLFEE